MTRYIYMYIYIYKCEQTIYNTYYHNMSDDEYDEFGNCDEMDDVVTQNDTLIPSNLNGNSVAEESGDTNGGLALIVRDAQNRGDTLSERFGPENATIITDHHIEGPEEPVIQPDIKKRGKFEINDSLNTDVPDDIVNQLPKVIYSRDYMVQTARQVPERIRNIAIVGNLHSGKTSLVDLLVLFTHSPSLSLSTKMKNLKPLRYTDNHIIETKRGISIKASPVTLLLQDISQKSFMFNIIDTPGHINFMSESIASMVASDGVVLVLDVVEGFSFKDKQLITEAMKYDLPLVLVLNKLDRLILELRLPISDTYNKLTYIIDEVNDYINSSEYISIYSHPKTLSPITDNVLFASSTFEFSFNLMSFTDLYFQNSHLQNVDPKAFARNLWGDVYYDQTNNKFSKSSGNGLFSRTFCHFILEPIYKIITYTLTRNDSSTLLSSLLKTNFGLTLPKQSFKLDSQILLREIFKQIFQQNYGLVNLIVNSVPSPVDNKMSKDEEEESLVGKVVKLVETSDGSGFYALVRICEGTLSVGDQVKVLGENFPEDRDDYKIETVSELFLCGGRYRVPIKEAGPGFIVLVNGIDSIISKNSMIYNVNTDLESELYSKIESPNYKPQSVLKVAVEPKVPSELPKLLTSLRKVNKAYLSSVIKIEESGEHLIFATGELMLDCILHDLRLFFVNDLEIKVSDPMVKLGETCSETSVVKINTKMPNSENEMSIIAEPLNDSKFSKAIEMGRIDLSQPQKVTSKILRNEFGWDALAARSLWAFGPDDGLQPNVLLDDTLEETTNKDSLYSIKESINLGFKWSCNEGPLCDEPIRNTKFKILDAIISNNKSQRSGAQIITMTRKACYTGFLTASPKLMEPIYDVHITCTFRAVDAIAKILSQRRGYVIHSEPIVGTQLFNVEGKVPVIESIGLETTIRLQTQGQSMCFLLFCNWEVAPGDPLDSECYLPDLKPVPNESIARDFVMKTRRRKGLGGEPNLKKYIEPELFEKMKTIGLM